MRSFQFSKAALVLLLGVAACNESSAQMAASQQRVRSESAAPVAAVADTSAAYALSAAFRSAADRALPAVVFVSVEREARMVRGRTPQQQMPDIPEQFRRFFELPGAQEFQAPPEEGAGSGFIIDSQGQIVTNHHVVANADRIEVRLHDGREFDAKLIASDPNTDVALIQINAAGERLPSIGFGDAQRLRVGDWVLALGNPLGFDFTVTAGIVSAKGRGRFTGNQMALESFIQTDAAINPGNSGGPLVDLTGRVVGVNTLIAGGGSRFVGYGFAVPADLVQRVIVDLKQYGHVRRPRLGVTVDDVHAVDAEVYGLSSVAGAEITSVAEGMPGARAGLRPGDVVLSLDGQPIQNGNELTTGLARKKPGDRVVLGVWRDKRRQEITATLGEFEQERTTANRPDSGRTSAEERLGFTVQPLTPQIASQLGYTQRSGLVIVSGVQQNSLLVAINNQPVSTPQDVARIAQSIKPGSAISIRVINPQLGETVVNYRAGR